MFVLEKMKEIKMKKLFLLLLFFIPLKGQSTFDTFFENKTLRLDYFHSGDAKNDDYSFDEMLEEPYWGGSKTHLLDPLNYGKYKVEVYDSASGALIYSKYYSTLFSEWQTTEEAKKYRKSFNESVVFPFPKKTVLVTFYSRDKKNELHKKFDFTVNPSNYFITKERRDEYPNFKVHYSGDPSTKVDIVIIPDGYTKDEMEKFQNDCKKFTQYLFNSSPYKENKDAFNIWGIEAPSLESGTDIPAQHVWKKTNVSTTFYTFDEERYCMTYDYKSVRDYAANAPYDQIYILVNTSKYGGGSIYNHYSVCVADNPRSEYIFVHEFGHGFAFLGDEYYTSSTAYLDFYPTDVEPLEPNLTTRVDFKSKWEDMVDKDIPIPTPNDPSYGHKVGLFEGGGYIAKNIFRPCFDCSMKSASVDNFCPVCKRAIRKMIDYYSK